MDEQLSQPDLAAQIADDVLRELQARKRPRGSTYRFQFNAGFTFRDAAKVVPYLSSLGITHIYASPYLRAQTGSVHGYDVCQHDQFNPEVGTVSDFLALVSALKEHGLGHVLDIVPNHMAASSENPWWIDVLENGPSSPFAHYFDIDWHPVKGELTNKVLLPILGEQYGKALEQGQLQLEYNEGNFTLHYFGSVLPIGPKSSVSILSHRLDELKGTLGEASDAFLDYQSIITSLENLPASSATSPEQSSLRRREKEVIKRRIRRLETDDSRVLEFILGNVRQFNGNVSDPRSFDRLDELLSNQAYRLCNWRAASDEVNYRRFFDVNGLAAICMEAPDVFEHAHRLIIQLVARGHVDGLRIDHIDGLLDPQQFLWRLQWAYVAELAAIALEKRSQAASEGVPLDHPPVLAIARKAEATASSTSAADEETHTRPATVIAGAISGAVMTQDDSVAAGVNHLHTTHKPQPATSLPTWVDIRLPVLRLLRDKLSIPFPDAALVGLGEKSAQADDAVDNTALNTPVNSRDLPLYVVVEKILGPEEPLPANWAVAGTSGYDYLQLLNGLFLSPEGLAAMVRFYERFIGEKLEFGEVVYRCKLMIVRFSMASELQMLAHRLNKVSEQHRQSRDFTLNMLRHALRETLACFPVYRTYAGSAGISDRDRRTVNLAIARSKRRNPAADSAIFDFIRAVLLFDHPPELSPEVIREREIFTGRFQQVTSPVMAKGVEDTAFYAYAPLVSVNEVGCHPDVAIVSVDGFHRDNADRQLKYCGTMLATSTHDTKRSEDVRARIHVLAEIGAQWGKACNQWLRLNRRLHCEVDGLPAPSRNDEYLFYQTLIGFWPTGEVTDEQHQNLIDRLQAYMEKATHEAKVRTSWVNPNAAYDNALREFVGKSLERRKDNRFLADFRKFLDGIVDIGLYTALSQTVLKIMSPGIPDIYQGQELWDYSLVDPDNRRPVDYALRERLLGEIQQQVAIGVSVQQQLALELATTPRDPRFKLFATWRLIQLRRYVASWICDAKYLPLTVTGARAEHVCAFAWEAPENNSSPRTIVVIAPRLLGQLAFAKGAESQTLCNPELWADTSISMPILASTSEATWTNLFSGSKITAGPQVFMRDIVAEFPTAVFTAD